MKSKHGVGIELAIIFMAFSFALSTLILSYVVSMHASRRVTDQYITYRAEMDQVGEYFFASVEAGEAFPISSDSEINDNGFCQTFADEHSFHYQTKVGYSNDSSQYTILYHKLNIRTGATEDANSTTVFSVIIKEKESTVWTSWFSTATKKTYEIVNWSSEELTLTDVDEDDWTDRKNEDTTHSLIYWIISWLKNLLGIS